MTSIGGSDAARAGDNATITGVPGIRVGHATDTENTTGCTVILLPETGVRCVVDVRGGAPGTRETPLLSEAVAEPIYAITLSGGSAFGLRTADGAMTWLAEHGVGFPMPFGPVPTVPAAIIYDLGVGNPIPPTAEMGYAACEAASDAPVVRGSVGAGMGATVGKLHGRAAAMRGGLGSAAVTVALETGSCTVGALFVVNAGGDVWDVAANRIVAGARDAEGWLNLRGDGLQIGMPPPRGTNTTVGVVATDAPVSRYVLTRMAISAHDGMARAIRPAHLPTDGDTIFVASTAAAERPSSTRETILLALAAERCVQQAILDAVLLATARDGIPAARDLRS
jgi:L-aminopeptidase/D-esterase-like protein